MTLRIYLRVVIIYTYIPDTPITIVEAKLCFLIISESPSSPYDSTVKLKYSGMQYLIRNRLA